MPTGPELGDFARDTITGFSGVVVGYYTYLNGCRRLAIQPTTLKDGKPIDSVTFDIEQLEVVREQHHQTLRQTGGPQPEPTRQSTPSR